MDIKRSGSQPSKAGPSDYFTGTVRIRPGDIVWFASNEKHWHGASPDCAMTHIAIGEMKDGTAVTWLEKVEDRDYLGET